MKKKHLREKGSHTLILLWRKNYNLCTESIHREFVKPRRIPPTESLSRNIYLVTVSNPSPQHAH